MSEENVPTVPDLEKSEEGETEKSEALLSPKEEELTDDPEKLRQQLKTTLGILKKTQSENEELKQKRGEISELKAVLLDVQNRVVEHGETLTVITDVLSSTSELDEEQKEQLETKRKAKQEQLKTWTEIASLAQIVGLMPDDPSLMPTLEAYRQGKHDEAIHLTKLAVQAKVSALTVAPKAEVKAEEKLEVKSVEKPKAPKVMKGSPTAPINWRDQPSGEKIKQALAELRES